MKSPTSSALPESQYKAEQALVTDHENSDAGTAFVITIPFLLSYPVSQLHDQSTLCHKDSIIS